MLAKISISKQLRSRSKMSVHNPWLLVGTVQTHTKYIRKRRLGNAMSSLTTERWDVFQSVGTLLFVKTSLLNITGQQTRALRYCDFWLRDSGGLGKNRNSILWGRCVRQFLGIRGQRTPGGGQEAFSERAWPLAGVLTCFGDGWVETNWSECANLQVGNYGSPPVRNFRTCDSSSWVWGLYFEVVCVFTSEGYLVAVPGLKWIYIWDVCTLTHRKWSRCLS